MSLFLADVASDLLRDTFHAKTVFGRVTQDVTALCDPIENYGKSITLPILDALTAGETFDWTDSSESITFQEVSTTDRTATIQTAAKGIYLRDKDLIQSKGALQENALTDMARVMAEMVDNACASEVLGASGTSTHTSSSLAMSDIWAMIGDFGANCSSDSFAGFVVSGKLYASLCGLTGFVDATKTYNVGNANGIVNDQCVGYIANIPVYLSDASGMWNSTQSKAKMILLKKGSLATVYQRKPVYEEQRDLSKLRTNIAGSMYYATKLVFPAQVSICTVTLGE